MAFSDVLDRCLVKWGADGVTVTTGWMSQPASTSARERTSEREGGPASTPATTPGAEDWKAALVSLEQQLHNEIRTSRSADAVVRTSSRPGADEATLRRVQELLAASEVRQERNLALRLTQFNRDVNVQRQADLVRIQQLFGHSEGEISKQRQMLNYVMRASAPQQ